MPKLSLRRKPRKEEAQQKAVEPTVNVAAEQNNVPTPIIAGPQNMGTQTANAARQNIQAPPQTQPMQISPQNQLPPPPPPIEPTVDEKKSKNKTKEKPKKEQKKTPLKIIKGSSSYVRRQTRKYLTLTALCIVVFAVILVSFVIRAVLLFSLDLIEVAGLLVCIAPVALSYFFMHKFRIYSGGLEGEKEVVQQLQKKLDNNYTLINSLYLNDYGGDIDHILLAPNGVFVLETKNWNGKIFCNEDVWERPGKPDMGSPSRQVKRNAAKIKRIIDLSPDLRGLDVYVEGVVVFTNNKATLELKNPSVTVVKAQNLTNYITNLQNGRNYTSQQLDTVRKELLNPNVKRVLRRNF
jgi:hypothetical protein